MKHWYLSSEYDEEFIYNIKLMCQLIELSNFLLLEEVNNNG